MATGAPLVAPLCQSCEADCLRWEPKSILSKPEIRSKGWAMDRRGFLRSTGIAPVGFPMYPQADTGEGRLDSLDSDNFKYEITSREIAPANG